MQCAPNRTDFFFFGLALQFPLCDFYMFEEEYANFCVHYGVLPESEMCHYHPLEMTNDIVQAELYDQVTKKEPAGVFEHTKTTASAKKGGNRKLSRMTCVGIAVLVLLGFNSAILLLLVVMQMFK